MLVLMVVLSSNHSTSEASSIIWSPNLQSVGHRESEILLAAMEGTEPV